ncbi:site-specific DNA-methyltransferase [Oscillochloris sp. ZM17-4]|uniref:DNA methyltransferase n=1 Tax=Oscillochloris sp. ZM17-4 TaxID=2866714 RepID=UPI001C739EB4|nr:DNA methyltransferase [Oscillochloris sp. ZM17-4]MBX0326341.1 site-specific DNA-methyltransferase [Oscillochloris sp. ZM17-4]
MAIAKLPTLAPPDLAGAPEAPPAEPADVTLRLRRDLLVECLAALTDAPTVAALRQSLGALRDRLGELGDPIYAGREAEQVRFSAAYLEGEFAQIGGALTIERARYYVDRLRRAAAVERTGAINEINLNRWKEYDDILTDSLWMIDRRDSSGVHTAGYWGNFIPQIPNQLMRRYTRRGDWVIDPFAGSGTTLIEGQRLGRNTLGVDLQPQMVEHARALVAAEPNRHGAISQVVAGDSTSTDFRALLASQGARSAQLAILHPPYHDIIRFSDDPRDLSNSPSIDEFLHLMGRVVENIAPALDRGRYLALVIGDKYARGEWFPMGFQTMSEVQERGFLLKSIVVKNIDGTAGKRSQKELWRYRALAGGFYVFKHEYMFLFKKR